MSKFKSLAAALKDQYEKPLADLSDDLHQWLERSRIPWDDLGFVARRRATLEWDIEQYPVNERAQERAFNIGYELERVKAMPAPIPSEELAKRTVLAELRREFAFLEAQEEAVTSECKAELPTYRPAASYSASAVPNQFTRWAEERNRGGVIITAPMAEDAMRGPKNENGDRAGGLLAEGTGLSRETIRAWVATLPNEWRARRGEPPSRTK